MAGSEDDRPAERSLSASRNLYLVFRADPADRGRGFLAGEAREHVMVLGGAWVATDGEPIALCQLNAETGQAGGALLTAREEGDALHIDFGAPLSAFQAFCTALALVHHAQLARNSALEATEPAAAPIAEQSMQAVSRV